MSYIRPSRNVGQQLRILFVDAGNFSRSPAAEVLTRRLVEQHGLAARVSVGSAGLKDKHAGGPPDPRTAAVCAERGLDLSGFLCRQIGEDDFNSDLILAMDGENLAALQAMKPDRSPARLDLFLSFAGGGDVPDPYFGGPEGFGEMMVLIERGAAALVANLAGRPAE